MSGALSEHLRLQAGACAAMGSPFSAGLLERALPALDADGPIAAAFAPWADADLRSLFDQAVALRWLGALHFLALSEPDAPLAQAYPGDGAPGDADLAWPRALEALSASGSWLARFMDHEPQTNEVRRSAVLLPGFLAVTAAAGLPLRLLELGASAGLNQLWDRRRYRLGPDLAWGPAEAALTLETDWHGGPPPLDAPVSVAERAACDRAPVDLADPVARRRLKAYVWPDQFDRLARLETSIAETVAAGVVVEREDAVAWTRRHAAPRRGFCTVVFHSVFFQYMPAASQTALTASLATASADASEASPLAWLRMEPAAANPALMELRLTLWPGGNDRLLANAHPHGAWVEWLG